MDEGGSVVVMPSDAKMAKYDIGQHVGRGGFANVFRAVDRTNGETVAVKIVNLRSLAEAGHQGRVEREVALHSSLCHPHVARLLDYFECEHEGYACLVVEYCEGGDLRSALRAAGKFTEREAARIVKQLLEGVAYLHSQGIVHRDLKLANVLVGGKSVVKICDFGVAARLSCRNAQERWTLCGTPNYMAPEVMRGTKPHGLAADMFSVGRILQALLIGKRYSCLAGNDHIAQGLDEAALREAGASDMAIDLVAKLTASDPDDRPDVEAALAHSFFYRRKPDVLAKPKWTSRAVTGWESAAAHAAARSPHCRPRPVDTRRLRPFSCSRRAQVVAIDSDGTARLECRVVDDLWARLVARPDRLVHVSLIKKDGTVIFDRPPSPPSRLDKRYWPLHAHLARAVELARSRTPRIISRITGIAGDLECVLMENGPLPDVAVCWSKPNAVARYSLRALCLELDLDGEHFTWQGRGFPSQGTPHAILKYVFDVQAGVKRCLETNRTCLGQPDDCFPVVVDDRKASSRSPVTRSSTSCASATTLLRPQSLSFLSDRASTADLDNLPAGGKVALTPRCRRCPRHTDLPPPAKLSGLLDRPCNMKLSPKRAPIDRMPHANAVGN